MTSKRLVARAAATLLLGLGALTGAHAQTVLKVSHFLPPGSNFQKNFLEPWCEKIAKDFEDHREAFADKYFDIDYAVELYDEWALVFRDAADHEGIVVYQ